jgi:hypothetical protein
MSQANVEIVERMTDAFNRRDVDAWMECATPDCELLPAMPKAVERAGYRGRTGVEAYVGEITETWEEYRLVPDESRDLVERVLMLGRIEVRGKGSGTPVTAIRGLLEEWLGSYKQFEMEVEVIVFDPAQALAFGDVLVGREAFRNEVTAAQEFFGARYKPSEVRAAGESQVLCRGEIGGIGAASGIEGYDRMSTLLPSATG